MQEFDAFRNNRIDGFRCVRVVSRCTLGHPLHEVEALGWGTKRHRILIEEIWDKSVVAVGSELVGHQLGILPDADDVWEVENGSLLVDILASGLSLVGIKRADFEAVARCLTTVIAWSVDCVWQFGSIAS